MSTVESDVHDLDEAYRRAEQEAYDEGYDEGYADAASDLDVATATLIEAIRRRGVNPLADFEVRWDAAERKLRVRQEGGAAFSI